MKDQNNHIDDLFRKGLENYKKPAPDGLWEELSAKLNRPQSNKKRYVWYRIAAAIALLLMVGSGIWFTRNHVKDSSHEEKTPVVSAVKDTPKTKDSDPTEKNEVSALEKSQIAEAEKPGKPEEMEREEIQLESQSGFAISENPEKTQMFTKESPKSKMAAGSQHLAQSQALSKIKPLHVSSIEPGNATVQNKDSQKPEGFTDALAKRTYELLNQRWDEEDKFLSDGDDNQLSISGRFTPLMAYSGAGSAKNDAGLNFENSWSYSNTSVSGEEKMHGAYNGGFNIEIPTKASFSFITGLQYARFQTRKDFAFFPSAGNHSKNSISNLMSYVVNNYNPVSLGTSSDNNNGTGSPVDEDRQDEETGQSSGTRLSQATENYDLNRVNAVQLGAEADKDQALYTRLNRKQLENISDIWQRYEFIEIPVYGKYPVLDRKMQIHMMGGLSANILVSHKHYVNSEGQKVFYKGMSSLATVNYSGLLGMGLSYPLIENFYISFQPAVKYHVFLDRQGAIYDSLDPFSLALYSGLSYRF